MKRVKYKIQLTFQQFYGFCQNLKPRVVRPGGGGSGGVASRSSDSTSCSASSLRWTFVTKSESHRIGHPPHTGMLWGRMQLWQK